MTKDKIKCDCPSCLAFGKHCPHKWKAEQFLKDLEKVK